MQRLYHVLEEKLRHYAELLEAVEEVSRCTSLPTVVHITVNGGRVREAREDIRLVQTTIQETGGWGKCSAGHLQSIGEHGTRAAELFLDHSRNLLNLCERSAMEFTEF